jgi:hypothetical protein
MQRYYKKNLKPISVIKLKKNSQAKRNQDYSVSKLATDINSHG